MSNFYGGSTIIKGGKFASHDPADDGFGYTARKKSNTQTSTKKSTEPTNKLKVASPQKILGSARKTLLHITIDQMLMGREAIKIPKTTHPDLLDALTAAGTPVTWAKNLKSNPRALISSAWHIFIWMTVNIIALVFRWQRL